ncbi:MULTISPECIES: hypothetical protein [Streptomyces]|uniref:Uncharacterized protein n=1 Tax=Streptomyces achmelvichensis TaxID=3134111 RepID=A0ACC6Q909_9ACTN|nr:hypothetical protein [Streptomyces sp. NBC_00306]
MTAGWCSRTLRAVVFAAICVLLAALGHVVITGIAVPWWALVVGVVATGGIAWWLAGRERGLFVVVSVAVAAQLLLDSLFSSAQLVLRPESSGEASLAWRWVPYLLCGPSTGSGADSEGIAMPLHSMSHDMGAMSSMGMLVAHLVAAVLCGLWLAHGERAAFRILRAVGGRLVAPLRLLLWIPAPTHRPRVRPRRGRSNRVPKQLLLVYAITSRGPPLRTAVV